jgi:selenocysteine-specific translation elongation factor
MSWIFRVPQETSVRVCKINSHIDVVSKYDLGVVDGALEELEEIWDGTPYIKLSIHEGEGIDELRTEVLRMLGEVRVVLDAIAGVDERSAR